MRGVHLLIATIASTLVAVLVALGTGTAVIPSGTHRTVLVDQDFPLVAHARAIARAYRSCPSPVPAPTQPITVAKQEAPLPQPQPLQPQENLSGDLCLRDSWLQRAPHGRFALLSVEHPPDPRTKAEAIACTPGKHAPNALMGAERK